MLQQAEMTKTKAPKRLRNGARRYAVCPAHYRTRRDDRVYNNIILATDEPPTKENRSYMSSIYDEFTTYDEYVETLKAAGARHDHSKYLNTAQPVWVAGNVYKGCARPFRAETDLLYITEGAVAIRNEGDRWILSLSLPVEVLSHQCKAVTTARLGAPRYTEEPYENPDGSPVDFSIDLLGNHRDDNVLAGPFACLTEGTQEIVVWKK